MFPSLNNPLQYFKFEFVWFESIVSWKQRIPGFSLDIRSINSAILYETPWLFLCMMLVLELLKTWICGGRLIELWSYICWHFIFLLTLKRAASFFIFFFSEKPVGRHSWWVLIFPLKTSVKSKRLSTIGLAFLLTTRAGSIFLFRTIRGYRSSRVRGVFFYCIWEYWFRIWIQSEKLSYGL